MVLLLDAANTIIYKPSFYVKFIEVLEKHKIFVEKDDFIRLHKIISEIHLFPDRTSKDFYTEFNSEVLYGLGVIPTIDLLENLFVACSYLKWEKFEDTEYLLQIQCKKAVLSNFHSGLNQIIDDLFSGEFTSLTISEDEKLRKPDSKFFERVIEKLEVDPSEILYIGDSIKLDLEPGLKVGMNAWLIDRNNYYPYCKRRLQSLSEILNIF